MEEIFYLILVIAYFIIVIFLYKIINILIPTSKKKITGIKLNKEDKKICKKKVSYFRDIPCNGDIYEAYFIATLYNLNKRESDLLGAVLLKWILEGKISMLENKQNGINLKAKEPKQFKKDYEQELYEILLQSSMDGILEAKEFKKWHASNAYELLGWFDRVLAQEKGYLIRKGKLIQVKTSKRKKYEVDSTLREDAISLAGLKRFLIDFSYIENKEVMETHIWEEYLIFAQMLGIADKIDKRFKDMYPDLLKDINYTELYDMFYPSDDVMKSNMKY